MIILPALRTPWWHCHRRVEYWNWMSVMFCGSVWIQFTTLLWMTICLFCRNKASLKWKTQCLCFTSPRHGWGPHHWHGPCSEPFSAISHFWIYPYMQCVWQHDEHNSLCSSQHHHNPYRIRPYASIQSLWGFHLFCHISISMKQVFLLLNPTEFKPQFRVEKFYQYNRRHHHHNQHVEITNTPNQHQMTWHHQDNSQTLCIAGLYYPGC